MVGRQKRNYALLALFVWLILIVVFMALSLVVNIEILFVLWLIGLLIILELTDLPFANPVHIRYAKYLAFAGVLLFGIIVIQKVMEILA